MAGPRGTGERGAGGSWELLGALLPPAGGALPRAEALPAVAGDFTGPAPGPEKNLARSYTALHSCDGQNTDFDQPEAQVVSYLR